MGETVVLLYWCSEWKNEFLFFFHRHGPCRNLLHAKQHSTSQNSLAYTTPTFKMHDVTCHIKDIFNVNTCTSCAQIPIMDWISLIQASYDHTLHELGEWANTGQDVDIHKLKTDMKRYHYYYMERQQAYTNTRLRDITYKWVENSRVQGKLRHTAACFRTAGYKGPCSDAGKLSPRVYESFHADGEHDEEGDDQDGQDNEQGDDYDELGPQFEDGSRASDHESSVYSDSQHDEERSVENEDDYDEFGQRCQDNFFGHRDETWSSGNEQEDGEYDDYLDELYHGEQQA